MPDYPPIALDLSVRPTFSKIMVAGDNCDLSVFPQQLNQIDAAANRTTRPKTRIKPVCTNQQSTLQENPTIVP